MKKFVVSEKCIACGNCLLETKLLQEDSEGKAVPVNGGYFSDDFLYPAYTDCQSTMLPLFLA